MKNKLVVLSFDSLENGDLEVLFKCPNFYRLKPQMAIVKELREIYPTLTYPIHTTMITGKLPAEHGIYHNQKSDLYPYGNDFSIMGENWYWEKENIKAETLIDKAHDANLTVATICWPVTAGDMRESNIPEIWPKSGTSEDAYEILSKSCSPKALEKYYESYLKNYNWSDNQDMVMFDPEIAIDILKNESPDLLLCHIIHLDHTRHVFGDQHFAVKNCLRQLDILMGRFVDACEQSGNLNNTNFVILGDHGQIDIENLFNLNVCLAEEGILTLDENNLPSDYVAYAVSSGFSTNVILKNPTSIEDEKKVYDVLCKIKNKYPAFIEKIFTKEQVLEEEGLTGNFSFVIEGTNGTMFDMHYCGDVVINKQSPKYNKYLATHGYHPNKGQKPPFVAFGPNIKKGSFVDRASMLDVYPTLLKLLGLETDEELKGTALNITVP